MLISFLKKYFFGQAFTRNLSVLIGTTAIGYSISLLLSPILTRIYSPSDFGVLQVFLSWYVFGFVVVCSRYDTAILIPEDEKTAFNLAIVSFCSVVGVSLLSIVIVALLHRFGQNLTQVRLLDSYLWLFPPALLFIGIYQVSSQLAVRNQAFKDVGKTKITQSIGQATVQLTLGALRLEAWGLIVGDIIGRFGGGMYLYQKMKKKYSSFFQTFRWDSVRQTAWKYREFPFVSSWSALINTTGLILPTLLFTDFYGLQTLGFFSLTERVFSTPNALFGQSVSQVYNGTASKLLNHPADLLAVFKKVALQLFLLGIIPFGLIIIMGPTLFRWVFGQDWEMAGRFGQVLALMQWVGFVSSPLSHTLNLLQKQRWQLGWDITRLILCLFCLYGAHYLSTEPFWGICAYTISLSLMYIVHLFLCIVAIKRIHLI